jgi:hypothetical protein
MPSGGAFTAGASHDVGRTGATRGITSRRSGVYGLHRQPAVVVCNQDRGRARGRRAPCHLGELSRRGSHDVGQTGVGARGSQVDLEISTEGA